MDSLTITRPDDWHLHLRDGAALETVVGYSARQFARAIIMPNLDPPVTNTDMALAYRERILAALPGDSDFQPLMTIYLTQTTSTDDIETAAACEHVHGVKLYPAGATTHSDAGVTDLTALYPVLDAMQKTGLVLQVHGEVTDASVDIFDREKLFIENILAPVVDKFPDLKVVFEHITTRDAVDFVHASRQGVAATITPQHLLLNRNALFDGGFRPHHFCLPVLKAEQHRESILQAAVSGDARFFLGTDSAPHAKSSKENACGCAGIFSAPVAIELYAEAFDSAGKLDALEGFASVYGAGFYGLPGNADTISLTRESWQVSDTVAFGEDALVPLYAGQHLGWQLKDTH